MTPWAWVPSINFAQGLQYAIAIQLFTIIFKTMGIPNGVSLFWSSLLTLPWTIKPLWGPLVDRYWTKRNWTVFMQLTVGVCLIGAAAAFMLPDSVNQFFTQTLNLTTPAFFLVSVFFLLILGFAAATHDIACDGYYMLALREKQQAFYVGIRSTAFRVALIVANGVLVVIAQMFQGHTGPPAVIASVTMPQATAMVAPPPTLGNAGEMGILVGNTAIALDYDVPATTSVRLSMAPPEKHPVAVVVSIHEPSVLKSIFLPGVNEGIKPDPERIEFTHENWDKPVEVKFAASPAPKTLKTSGVYYKFTAGDIGLSWAAVLGFCGLMYLGFFILHKTVMPIPALDVPPPGHRAPFYQPLVALFVTLAVPAGIGYLIFILVGKTEPQVKAWAADRISEKGFSFFFSVAKFAAIGVVMGLPLLARPVRAAVAGFFVKMSDLSSIGFADVFSTFFKKPGIMPTLGFLLTYRLGEAQLGLIKNVFLLDDHAKGGLGMSLGQLAFVNTLIYLVPLTVGGLVGGFLIAKFGLKKIIWFMVAVMHLPNLAFVWMSHFLDAPVWQQYACIGIEAFGYGLGFTSYLMVMIMAAQGPYKTAHYALCTGFMSLGVMIPGMWTGYLQEAIGYINFFWWIMISCIPGMLFIPFLSIDENFGRKKPA